MAIDRGMKNPGLSRLVRSATLFHAPASLKKKK
jgi:hypothetical protein